MRISLIKNPRGVAAAFFMMMIPLFIALIAGVLWIGVVSISKIRLQSAADVAVKAGAAAMADSLNRIANLNRELYLAYLELGRDLTKDSQQNLDAAKQRISKYARVKEGILSEMESLRSAMMPRARSIAQLSLSSLIGEHEGVVETSPEIVLSTDSLPDQWSELGFDFITGNSFVDPEAWESSSYNALRFIRKIRRPDSWIAVFAKKQVVPLIAHRSGQLAYAMAFSAAKAFGGSLECHAAPDIERCRYDAEDRVYDHLYHSASIPLQSLN
jgi:hypothetical protein